MKRKVFFGALEGLALALLLCLSDGTNRAFCAAQLDGFAINTHDKSVTITLYTDQRTPYTTESAGRQFSIILPDAQLSKRQTDEGMPVVIDNKNRFIGRAVTTADGKVKVILPNLPANQYAVSIRQQSPSTLLAEAESRPVPALSHAGKSVQSPPPVKPRPAVKAASENRFEQITAVMPVSSTSDRLASNTARQTEIASGALQSSHGTIWNPYVVKKQSDSSSVETSQPMKLAMSPETNPVSTMPTANWNAMAVPAPGFPTDPLRALHALPLMNPMATPPSFPFAPLAANAGSTGKAAVPTTEKTANAPPSSSVSSKNTSITPSKPMIPVPAQGHRLLAAIPTWIWAALALFLGGIGLFSLIGSLSLLRLVFLRNDLSLSLSAEQTLHTRQKKTKTSSFATSRSGDALPFPRQKSISWREKNASSYPGFVSKPPAANTTAARKAEFADTATINALDYTTRASRTVSEALKSSMRPHSSLRRAATLSRKAPAQA